MSLFKILIYLIALAAILVGVISMASATSYYVEVHDGVGAGDGSPPLTEEEEEEEEDEDPETNETEHSVSINQKIELGEDLKKHNLKIGVSEDIGLHNTLTTTDTAEKPKEPVNWTPIIIWGIIITILIILAWGGWWIYQIYFY